VTWERISTELGRGAAVTVSWRIPGGRCTPAMALSLSKAVCAQLGLQRRGTGEPPTRVYVERDRLAGKVRVQLAPKTAARHECRAAAWKDGSCTITVPLDDVKLAEKKPAQDVPWSIEGGWLVAKLPHWACPLVQVSGGRAA
jgi:hypothetical protein